VQHRFREVAREGGAKQDCCRLCSSFSPLGGEKVAGGRMRGEREAMLNGDGAPLDLRITRVSTFFSDRAW
jgi:hypothetical protein